MVTTAKEKEKKRQTKLKKRKLEKHKRKQLESKFLYRNKSNLIAISIIAIVLVGSFVGYGLYRSSQEGKSTVDLGDEIKFNFICYYDNGEVIQHTLVTNPNDVTVDSDLSGNQLKNPQKLLIGGYQTVSGILIPLYWNDGMFVGEKKGETFYMSIPAENVYGPVNSPFAEEERIFNVPRSTERDRFVDIELESFVEDYGEPEVGMELVIEEENAKITSIAEDYVTYELIYDVGDEIFYEYGKGQVTAITDDMIELFYDGSTEDTFYAQHNDVWVPVHIMDTTEDELVLEVDHYNFKIYIDDIEKNVIDQDDWAISDGDFAIVRYIGYYEDGEVFDFSIISDTDVTKDTALDNSFEHSPLYITVQPGNTIQGTSTVIEGFNEALKGMVAGEEKVIEVPPEEGYGEYDETLLEEIDALVGTYDIIETFPKITTLTLEEYIAEYGDQPLLGNPVSLPYGTGTITDIEDGVTISLEAYSEDDFYHNNVLASVIEEDDVSITIEHYPIDGGQVFLENGGYAYVTIDGDTFVIEYDLEGLEVGGTFANGTITEIGELSFTLDRNHPMAGDTLYFKIRVVDFRKVK